jgi:general stress protein 26
MTTPAEWGFGTGMICPVPMPSVRRADPAPDRLPKETFMQEVPALDELETRLWTELVRASADRHHEWRTPVLASVDADGAPQARTVVLRRADVAARVLEVFTDRRTPKVAQLRHEPRVSVVFWSNRLHWQLRVQARAEVLVDGPDVARAWGRLSQGASAADYLAPRVPGTPLSVEPGEAGDGHHLAVLRFDVVSLDWLALRREGHRRARIDAAAAVWVEP